MGESKDARFRLDFDHQLDLEFHGSTVTSDTRLLADRELDDALAVEESRATNVKARDAWIRTQ